MVSSDSYLKQRNCILNGPEQTLLPGRPTGLPKSLQEQLSSLPVIPTSCVERE